MAIRPATKDDLSILQNLNKQIFEYEIEVCAPLGWNANYPFEPAGIDYLQKAVNKEDGFHAFIYDRDSNPTGYMILKFIPESELKHRINVLQLQIHTLCVDSNSRGQGVGKELIEYAKQCASENNINTLKVFSMAGSSMARKFYRDCGFEEFEITHEMQISKE